MLHVDGTATIPIPSTLGGSSYYVVVKHRNSMETWSKNLVLFTGSTVTFDFTAP